MDLLFGTFIYKKRTEKQISLRGFARMIEISPVYVSSIEKGTRAAPTEDILNNIAKILVLNEEEKDLMYDLAAKSKNTLSIATDLVVYINKNTMAHKALRLSKKVNANDDDWQTFVDYLNEKYS